jgi:hypothetical protein
MTSWNTHLSRKPGDPLVTVMIPMIATHLRKGLGLRNQSLNLGQRPAAMSKDLVKEPKTSQKLCKLMMDSVTRS